jgi:hypothetical protein
MPGPQPVINLAEAKDALIRSGYLLESRVEAVLRDSPYYVQANASYSDPETGKSREYDLYAMGAHKAGPAEADYQFTVLLIECVNNPQPLVLLTKEPQAAFLHRDEVKVSGMPAKLPNPKQAGGWLSLAEALDFDKFHHYCKGRVATQYCTFQQKKNDGPWMAWHDEEHYDGFKKLCDAVDYHEKDHYTKWRFDDRPERVNLEVHYPLLVLQGELWDARTTKNSVKLKRARHLQLRRSVAGPTREHSYQIDVIEERFLRTYLDLVKKEGATIAQRLRERGAEVRQAINTITQAAKAAATPADREAAMRP